LSASFAMPIQACEASASGKEAQTPTRQVAKVIDAETLELDDGAKLRLLGIEAPGQTLARKEKTALSALTLGKTVQLAPDKPPRDRYGRLLAQVFVIDALGAPTAWVQGRLVEQGLARVATRKESRACAAELLGLEAKARAAQEGLWALAAYAIRSADTIPPYDIGTFQLVEGTVQDVAIVGGRTYINFGPDWKTDFTVTIAARDRKLFAADALDPPVMRGRKIRVRGFIERLNGPMIAVTHPEEIEMLP
jgi:endonuclease YncB( thermonuclease family)